MLRRMEKQQLLARRHLLPGVMLGLTLVPLMMGCSGPGGTAASYGTITTYAGTGASGFFGNGGPADKALMIGPICVALNATDDLFISDPENLDVRKVLGSSQVISTYAGTGKAGYSGDGQLAMKAEFNGPEGCATDASGNLYLVDTGNNVIRKISAATGVITTVVGNGDFAGTGNGGFSGDGGPALQAELNHPFSVAVDGAGNLYVSDVMNERIRKVSAASGVITTIAGSDGVIAEGGPYPGDGKAAVDAALANPTGIAVDSIGNLYFADSNHNAIREVNASTGVISTVAGNGTPGYSGDGGPASKALLSVPVGVTFDRAGDLYIADSGNSVVRKVTMSTGVIQSVVGNGKEGYSGDGGSATNAELKSVYQVAFDSKGNMYIPDPSSGVVRKVTPNH